MKNFETEMIETAEINRREHPSVDAGPLSSNILEVLKELGLEGVGDYSEYGNIIDRAVHHLDEALPNGQLLRASCAFVALNSAVRKLGNWMAAKGYIVCRDPRDIVNTEELKPLRLNKSSFIGREGRLMEGQHFTMTYDQENPKEGRRDRIGFAVTTAYRVTDAKMRFGKTYYEVNEMGEIFEREFRVQEQGIEKE